MSVKLFHEARLICPNEPAVLVICEPATSSSDENIPKKQCCY